jgi:division/cell wall cluster transcriptional repressor MraZ
MVTRKTQCTWMALGGILCLFGVVLTCKIREGTPVTAGDEKTALPAVPVPVPPHGDMAKEKEQSEPSDPKDVEHVMEPDSAARAATPPAVPMPDGTGTPLPPLTPAGPQGGGSEFSITAVGVRPSSPTAAAEATAPPIPVPGAPPMLAGKPDVSGPPPLGSPTSPTGSFVGFPTVPMNGTGIAPPASPMAPPPGIPTSTGNPLQGSTIPSVAPPMPGSPIMPTQGTGAPASSGPPPIGSAPLGPPRTELIAPMATPPRSEPGEPPLAGHTASVQTYVVSSPSGETLRDVARRTLGASERWEEIARLNPTCKPDGVLARGYVVRLPADACIPTEDVEAVKPLPPLRSKAEEKKGKDVQPLTGTFPCNLDDHKQLTLPRAIREQLGQKILLISPGSDHCLWITDTAHLERLATRLENSPAREIDVRIFKRLYFAQTEKVTLTPEGRIQVSDRLAQFAGLHQEVVLVGIDDHFELWDVARWRQYTQEKSAAARTTTDSE